MGMSVLIIILGFGLPTLLLANFVRAIGFNLKEMCEPTLLQNSIPETKGKSDIFSRLDSRGNSYYFLLAGISSITAGFLFIVNPYLPMIIAFMFCLIATLISSRFEDVDIPKPSRTTVRSQRMRRYIKDLRQALKFIFTSDRLKSLLIISSIVSSLLFIFGILQNALLYYLYVPPEYFGIIHAAALFVSAVSSKRQAWFHRKYKNRALSWLSLPTAFTMLLTGLLIISDINIYVIYLSTALMILILAIVRGPYFTLVSRYYNNFATKEINTKIFTAKSLVESLARSAMFFFASFLMGITNIAYTLTILGCILTMLFIFTLEYMKNKIRT